MLLFDKILDFTHAVIPARALLDYESRTRVHFANGSEIIALPCGRDEATLRGFTADMVILHEFGFIPRIIIDFVTRPTMITRSDARLIMISTPWMRDHPFYEAMSKPELGFKTYTWPTSMNPKISQERLELERNTIGEYDFNREYNAVNPPPPVGRDSVIKLERTMTASGLWLWECTRPKSRPSLKSRDHTQNGLNEC